MTEQEKFLASFAAKQKKGLVDIKFFVNQNPDLTVERFFAAANRIDEAVSGGKCHSHDVWPLLEQRDIRGMLD